MGYLFLAILSMCMFMLLLKVFTIKGWNIPQAILINYIIASAIGIASYGGEVSAEALFGNRWWYLAVISGALFFFSSDLMAASTRWAGMAVTTIASRTALVVPIIFSVIFLNESIGIWEVAGIVIIIAALFMIFYQKGESGAIGVLHGKDKIKSILLPALVFASMGIITVCMKSTQHIIREAGNYETDFPLYQAMTFVSAVICGTVYYGFTIGRRAFIPNAKSVIGGVFVGGFNYLVTISILFALNVLSTSVFYASYNISVVLITAVLSVAVFKEKLTPLKIAGLCLSLIAITILLLS